MGAVSFHFGSQPKSSHQKNKGTQNQGSLVCKADREKKKKQNTKIFQDKYMAPILEASSKTWIDCCQQWHKFPGTSVGLVSSQRSFEEGTVQGGKKIQLPPHTALILSAEQLATAIPSQQQVGNQKGAINAAGSCLLMERAGSGSNWLGKDFFQKTVLQGGFRKAGTSPHGSKQATLKHAVGR